MCIRDRVRSEAQREALEADCAEVRLLDIESDPEDRWDEAMRGSDVVVFAAGGGADGNVERKRTVDLEGSLKAAAAAQRLGIKRFVQISAMSVDEPVAQDAAPAWAAYVAAKREADKALRETDLDWTIVRPGRLTDQQPSGLVTAATEVRRDEIARADVAAMLAELITTGAAVRKQFELIGGATPIAEAVAGL